jgi:uncharacterized protein YbjT (DUF2867 family)
MKTALIYGSTGFIGRKLLNHLLENQQYEEVIALTRKPLDIQNDRLNQIIYDFEKPDSKVLKADHVFCCLGTTIKNAGSQERFYRIDHDYVVETARLAYGQGATLFSLVSAQGANSKSRIFYSRVKGEIEKDLKTIGYAGLHIFRPSMLLGKRKEFRLMELVAKKLMVFFAFMIPVKYQGVQGSKVAAVMAAYARQFPGDSLTVSNEEIIRFKLD